MDLVLVLGVVGMRHVVAAVRIRGSGSVASIRLARLCPTSTGVPLTVAGVAAGNGTGSVGRMCSDVGEHELIVTDGLGNVTYRVSRDLGDRGHSRVASRWLLWVFFLWCVLCAGCVVCVCCALRSSRSVSASVTVDGSGAGCIDGLEAARLIGRSSINVAGTGNTSVSVGRKSLLSWRGIVRVGLRIAENVRYKREKCKSRDNRYEIHKR